MLLFRGQTLDPDAHIAFSRRFGALQEVAQKQYQMAGKPEIYIIGNVEENGRAIGDPSVGRLWHSDQSFLPHPAIGSLLYGVDCPEQGADTLFANMYKAYDALSQELQWRIERLHAVHSFSEYYEALRDRDPTQPELTDSRRALYPDVVHPLVRRNPRTGRKALYINPGYATAIVELPGPEGTQLLRDLCEHCSRDEFVYRHKWQNGDLLFWDNLAVNHKGTPFDTDPLHTADAPNDRCRRSGYLPRKPAELVRRSSERINCFQIRHLLRELWRCGLGARPLIGQLEHGLDRLDDDIGMDVVNHVTGVWQNAQSRAGNIAMQAHRVPAMVDGLVAVAGHDNHRYTDFAIVRTGPFSPLSKSSAVLGARA